MPLHHMAITIPPPNLPTAVTSESAPQAGYAQETLLARQRKVKDLKEGGKKKKRKIKG